MLRILSVLLILLFVTACDKEKEVANLEAAKVAASGNEYMADIMFKNVSYVVDKGTPRVEITVGDDSMFYDYGNSTGDARYWFDKFYMPAFGNQGLITYNIVNGERVINRGCYSCTSIDPR